MYNLQLLKTGDSNMLDLSYVLHKAPLGVIEKAISELPKHRLCEISKMISTIRKVKYVRDRTVKYGNLPRCFDTIQLFTLFSYIQHLPTKRYLLIQFFYALRVSEVPKIEILAEQKLIKIVNDKCSRTEYLPIIDGTEKLFYNFEQTRKLNPNVVRKTFRRACAKAGLNYAYCKDVRGLNRHQFSTHSLRHTGINIFGAYIKDQYKAMVYSRHSSKALGTISTYRHYSLDEMRIDLNTCFHNYTI